MTLTPCEPIMHHPSFLRLIRAIGVLALLVTLTATPPLCAATATQADTLPSWMSLFDGSSLDEWETIGSAVWRIEDGVMVGTQDGDPARSGLIMSRRQFQDFELELDFMIDEHGTYNSGVYLRNTPGSGARSGYQVNIGRGVAEEYCGLFYRDWLSKGDADDSIRKINDWNHYRIIAHGPHIVVYLNGKKIVDYVDPQPEAKLLQKGVIAFQTYGAEGHAGWVKFRNIRIRELPDPLPIPESLPEDAFSIIALPDTQVYSRLYPDLFLAQTEWIKQNVEALKIACVVHEGDITDRNSIPEWEAADRAMSVLDGVVPYCMALGNHDLAPGGNAAVRDAEHFNHYFGTQRFENYAWYGGHFEEGNENAYYLIDTPTINLLVLCLEFGPRDETLAWATEIVRKHPDRRAILVTHCYMYSDETRVGEGDDWNPHDYGVKGNDGEEIWENLIRENKEFFLVLSGHILHDGLGRLTSTGAHHQTVHQVLANYQMKEQGGNARLRIITFLPSAGKIVFNTYSPVLGHFETDPQNQFELPLLLHSETE